MRVPRPTTRDIARAGQAAAAACGAARRTGCRHVARRSHAPGITRHTGERVAEAALPMHPSGPRSVATRKSSVSDSLGWVHVDRSASTESGEEEPQAKCDAVPPNGSVPESRATCAARVMCVRTTEALVRRQESLVPDYRLEHQVPPDILHAGQGTSAASSLQALCAKWVPGVRCCAAVSDAGARLGA